MSNIRCIECGSSNIIEFLDEKRHVYCKRCNRPTLKAVGGNRKTEITLGVEIESIVFVSPFTIVKWSDGEETKVKISGDDTFREDYGLAMAITRRLFGRGEFIELVENATRKDGMTLKEHDKKMEERCKRQEKAKKKALKLSKK